MNTKQVAIQIGHCTNAAIIPGKLPLPGQTTYKLSYNVWKVEVEVPKRGFSTKLNISNCPFCGMAVTVKAHSSIPIRTGQAVVALLIAADIVAACFNPGWLALLLLPGIGLVSAFFFHAPDLQFRTKTQYHKVFPLKRLV